MSYDWSYSVESWGLRCPYSAIVYLSNSSCESTYTCKLCPSSKHTVSGLKQRSTKSLSCMKSVSIASNLSTTLYCLSMSSDFHLLLAANKFSMSLSIGSNWVRILLQIWSVKSLMTSVNRTDYCCLNSVKSFRRFVIYSLSSVASILASACLDFSSKKRGSKYLNFTNRFKSYSYSSRVKMSYELWDC